MHQDIFLWLSSKTRSTYKFTCLRHITIHVTVSLDGLTTEHDHCASKYHAQLTHFNTLQVIILHTSHVGAHFLNVPCPFRAKIYLQCTLWFLSISCVLVHNWTPVWRNWPTDVNIGSGNGLVPSGSKPLPEPMLTCIFKHQVRLLFHPSTSEETHNT